MDNYNTELNEEVIDLKQIFYKFLKYWYLFIIAIILSLAVAYLFNKFSKPIYKVSTTILIKDEKSAFDAQALLGLGNLKNAQSIENEIGVLKSRSLITRAIRSQNFDISYFSEENFITQELYDQSPFTVVFDTLFPQPAGMRFNIIINNNKEYNLTAVGEKASLYYYTHTRKDIPINEPINISGNYKFGQEVKGKYHNFKVILNHNFNPDKHLETNMFFVFNKIEDLTKEFGNFIIEPINREASIVEISLQSNNVQKASDFLNALTTEYLERSLEKKNQIATNTILFIDEQLLGITDSLQIAESDLQQFRTTNEVMDLDFQSQQVFQTMEDLEKQKAELIVKNQYYNYLSDYLKSNRNDLTGLTVPSSMGIEDPVLTRLITDLTSLYAERGEARLMAKDKNPIISSFDQRIDVNKKTLAENIKNIINTSNIAIKDIDRRINAMSGKINQLPTTQRMLFGIERKFKLNDAIYTFLLEKRSDAQITRASNMPDNEVLDIADPLEMLPVLPKKTLNYTIALLIGIILPIGYILGKDYLNDKIMDKKDIEKITSLPIVGHVIHSSKSSKLVVAEYPKSSIAESFRLIRTNLQYFTKNKEKQVILITSTMVNEGKTFTSMNVASIFALYGKRTLIVGYDLRKPKIYQDFGLSNTLGVSSYLINKCTLDEIVQKTSLQNLDFIAAGPVPPNPAELIASPKNDELIDQLKQLYDFIIIDTPPVGIVTDAFLLMKYSDVNVFVTRQAFTVKKIFETIITDIEKRELKDIAILINDVRYENNSYGYGYGNGYGYGYGYGYGDGHGYYTDDDTEEAGKRKKKSKRKKIIG